MQFALHLVNARLQLRSRDFSIFHFPSSIENPARSGGGRRLLNRFSGLLSALLMLVALTLPLRCLAAHQDAVTFSPSGGVFTNLVSLQLSASTPGAQVRYTLDGSEPTADSLLYSKPITITNSLLIRAALFASKSNQLSQSSASVASESYTLLDPELFAFDSNLPLLIINSYGEEIDKENKTVASVRLISPDGKRASILGPAEFDGRALVNLRGRASLRYPKRSYTFRPIDEQDDFKKVSLLGLPSDSDWVLYAPYPDKTFIRDVLAYELSNRMGQYASRTRFLEVFVNEPANSASPGSSAPQAGRLTKLHYLGVYVLEEKIRRGKDRVDIAKLGPDDNAEPKITGGYIFKKDHGADGGEMREVNLGGFPGGMSSSSSNRFGFPTGPGGFPADPAGFLPPYTGPMRESSSSSSSSSSRRTTSTTTSITNRIGLFPDENDELLNYRITYSSSSTSKRERFTTKPQTNEFYYFYPEPDEITAPQRAWLIAYLNKFETTLSGKNFLDPTNGYQSFIDIPSFIDHHIIVEMSKNVDGYRFSTFFHKDRGGTIKMGPIWDWNLSFGNANGKQGWLPEYWMWPQLTDKEYSWFRRLFQDPDFAQRYVDRWAELRTNVLATSNIIARVDYYTNLLNEAQVRNYDRWPILGRQVWPQYAWGNTYAEEVEFMKDWIVKRLAWIDAQFLAPPSFSLSPLGGEAGGEGAARQLTLTAPKGDIYYTLNGSDPRQPGGQPSPNATKYAGPLKSSPKSSLFVRAKDGPRWSAGLLRNF